MWSKGKERKGKLVRCGIVSLEFPGVVEPKRVKVLCVSIVPRTRAISLSFLSQPFTDASATKSSDKAAQERKGKEKADFFPVRGFVCPPGRVALLGSVV